MQDYIPGWCAGITVSALTGVRYLPVNQRHNMIAAPSLLQERKSSCRRFLFRPGSAGSGPFEIPFHGGIFFPGPDGRKDAAGMIYAGIHAPSPG